MHTQTKRERLRTIFTYYIKTSQNTGTFPCLLSRFISVLTLFYQAHVVHPAGLAPRTHGIISSLAALSLFDASAAPTASSFGQSLAVRDLHVPIEIEIFYNDRFQSNYSTDCNFWNFVCLVKVFTPIHHTSLLSRVRLYK